MTIEPTAQPPASLLQGARALAARLYPGAALASVFGIAAYAIAARYGAPAMLIALLLGLAARFLYEFETVRPGVDWAGRDLLRLGVALLGLRIAFADIASLGPGPLLLVALAMLGTLLGGVAFARGLGLSRPFGALSSGAVAVCGVSAAIAIASVLPRRSEGERDLAVVVAGVTTLSTLAMVLYPVLDLALRLSDREMGVVLGGSIHDVAQVLGAGYSISHEAGDTAAIVKLMRVSALLPVVVGLYLWMGRGGGAGIGRGGYLPPFLVGFFVLAAINSLGWAPPAVLAAGVAASQWLLLIAIAALGLKTDLRKIAEVGWKPVIALICQTLIMLAIVLAGVFALRWL